MKDSTTVRLLVEVTFPGATSDIEYLETEVQPWIEEALTNQCARPGGPLGFTVSPATATGEEK